MRICLKFNLLLLTAGVALATADTVQDKADLTPVPDDRQGGDTIEDAYIITSLPFEDTGTTVGYGDEYFEACPYTGNSSPDVVYSYTPAVDMLVDATTCNPGTFYDTKIYVYENEVTPGSPLGCNDDACDGPDFPYPYLSRLTEMQFLAGNTYYIIIGGYNGVSGIYALKVEETPFCWVECPPGADLEGEPVCYNGYDDQYNSGCGGTPPVFSPITFGTPVCGTSGNYIFEDMALRDSDWFEFELTETLTVDCRLFSEFPAQLLLIDSMGGDCNSIEILESASGYICEEIGIQWMLTSGLYWIWVGPSDFWGTECGEAYLLTLNYALPPISDLAIECDGEQVLLYWSDMPEAILYRIYGSSEPFTGFEEIDTTTDTFWGTTMGRDGWFFRVTYEVEE